MKIVDYYSKENWGDGVWQKEPDGAFWIDDETNYCCMVRRNTYGTWAGYVGVDNNHPFFCLNKRHHRYNTILVHGGVTFSDYDVKSDGEFYPPIRRWWIGFDCFKNVDLVPTKLAELPAVKNIHTPIKTAEYRTYTFVIDQTNQLAYQLGCVDTRKNLKRSI